MSNKYLTLTILFLHLFHCVSSSIFNATSIIILEKHPIVGQLLLVERTVSPGYNFSRVTLLIPSVSIGLNAACTSFGTGGITTYLDMQRSVDGRYLLFPCYNASLNTVLATALTKERVIARVDSNGIVDTTTALKDCSTINSHTSIASRDGSSYYISIYLEGIRYALHGGTTSTRIVAAAVMPTANRVGLWFGELWASGAAGNPQATRGYVRIGSGAAPTTLTTVIKSLPGYMTVTQQAQALLCVGFEFISPYTLGGSCDSSADGYDYYQ